MGDTTFTIQNNFIIIKDFLKRWKAVFLSTFIFGLFSHGYAMANYLPTYDSILNTNSVGATYSSGRWFLKAVGNLFSSSSIPWVNGLISLLFIALTVILILKMFDIKDTFSAVLTSALFVTFPTIVSTFSFIFTADCYMIAFFLSVLGVYLCYQYPKFGFIFGALPICLSIAVYQSYLSVSIICVVILFIKDLFTTEIDFKGSIKKYWKYVASVFLGLILYEIVSKIVLHFMAAELSGYQGIGKTGLLSFSELVKAVGMNIVSILDIFGIELFEIEGRPLRIGFYSVLNIVIFVFLFIFTVISIKKSKIYKKPVNMILLIVSYIMLPVSVCLFRYFTPDVKYSAIMEMSACFFYFMIVLYYCELRQRQKVHKCIKSLAVLTLCLVVFYNAINANVNYYNMQLRYNRTIAIASDVIDDVCDTDGYKSTDKVAVIGAGLNLTDEQYNNNNTLPYIRGSENSQTVLITQHHYITFWNEFLGIKVNSATFDEACNVSQSEEFKEMPCYPQDGYVKRIDGIIVVKLSENGVNYS